MGFPIDDRELAGGSLLVAGPLPNLYVDETRRGAEDCVRKLSLQMEQALQW